MVKHPARFPQLLGRPWRTVWLALAIVYALPVGWVAYHRVINVTQEARERLIVHYQLWETERQYIGKPQMWTRFAAHLLTDRQLLRRVHAKYGDLAPQIELDYRSDLTIAQARVIVVALGLWALPLGVIYAIGIGIARLRRSRPKPVKAPPPSASDAR